MFDVGEKLSILVVDDDANSRFAVKSVLDVLDVSIIEAVSGEDALRQVLKREFATIILDIGLPGMDGFQTALAIRERKLSNEIPIIFLTGLEYENSDIGRGYELGAVDYLIKPIINEIFLAKVKFAIGYRKVILDVLEKQQKTDELLKMVSELEYSNREIKNMTYIFSNESKELIGDIAKQVNFLQHENISDSDKLNLKRLVEIVDRWETLLDNQLKTIERSSE